MYNHPTKNVTVIKGKHQPSIISTDRQKDSKRENATSREILYDQTPDKNADWCRHEISTVNAEIFVGD